MISEIRKEIADLDTTRKALRNFGLLFCAVFAIWAAILLSKESSVWKWPAALGIAFLLTGIFFPTALRQIYRLWMSLAFVLGWLMTRLILTATFFLVMMPIGRLLKMMGKDLLDEKMQDESDTFWKEHKQSGEQQYRKQF